MIRLLVTAPRGKMGRLIIKTAFESEDIEITGVIGPKGREYIGVDAGLVAGLGEDTGIPVSDDLEKIIDICDVIVDFSTVESTLEIIKEAVKHKKPILCGVTGFTHDQEEEMLKAAKEIPLLKAHNTSHMVNVMKNLLRISAVTLCNECDIDIIDMHDEKKLDAPSGTAKEFGHAMELAAANNPIRINYHSIRSGDTPSSHTVIFGGKGERLEVTHHSYNWECFAIGACNGARFLKGKPAGLYTMDDVIGRENIMCY